MEQGKNSTYQDEHARDAAWQADRATEAQPLPEADRGRYSSEPMRGAALAGAERGNVAHAAGELGLTSQEWQDLRSRLGRSPNRGDIR